MKGKGSLCEREIIQKLSSKIIEFHSTFSRHGNTQASLHCSFGLTKKFKKLLSGAPDGAPMEGVALRARNLSKSFQNQTESARYAWKDSANRGHSSLLELLRCSLSYGKIVQTEGNQACLNC